MNKTNKIILGIIVLILVIFVYLNITECQCDYNAAPKCAEGQEISSEKYKLNWYCLKSCSKPVCIPMLYE